MTADSSSITVASTTPSQCKSNAALAYFASFGMGRGRRVSETADHSPAGRTPVVALFFRSPISAVARTSRRSSAHQPVYATQSLFAKFSDRREVCSLSISSEHGLGACTPSAAFSPLLRADPGREKCAFATPTESLYSEALELRSGRRSFRIPCAGVAELADALDSKSSDRKIVWVRAPPPAILSAGIVPSLNI